MLAVNWPPQAPAPGGDLLERVQFLVAHAPRGVCADGLEDLLDRDLGAVEVARADGAAIEHQRRHVQAGEGHDAAGNRLVAAGDGEHGVEVVGRGDELDRVRDQLARDQ